MVLKRVMPCLLLKNKRLVKTINFKNPQYIGDPINAVKIFNDKDVDELILLDIEASKENKKIDFDLLKDFAAECFMPLAYGGGVKRVEDFKKLFRLGIEKVIVNTLLFSNPNEVAKAIGLFGSQSVVASVDVKKDENGNYQIFSHSGYLEKAITVNDFITFVQNIGVGEIFLTSVDNEGTWNGFDESLILKQVGDTKIPLIVNGGCGSVMDLKHILTNKSVQAAAIGSMAVYQKKNMGVLIRFPKRNQIMDDE